MTDKTLHQESNLPTKESGCKHETLTRSIWNDYTWNCEQCGKAFNLGKTLELLEAEMKWKI